MVLLFVLRNTLYLEIYRACSKVVITRNNWFFGSMFNFLRVICKGTLISHGVWWRRAFLFFSVFEYLCVRIVFILWHRTISMGFQTVSVWWETLHISSNHWFITTRKLRHLFVLWRWGWFSFSLINNTNLLDLNIMLRHERSWCT